MGPGGGFCAFWSRMLCVYIYVLIDLYRMDDLTWFMSFWLKNTDLSCVLCVLLSLVSTCFLVFLMSVCFFGYDMGVFFLSYLRLPNRHCSL